MEQERSLLQMVVNRHSPDIFYHHKLHSPIYFGEWNGGNPLQYSCLEKPMDRGAWWAIVQRVAKSWTRLWPWLECGRGWGQGKGAESEAGLRRGSGGEGAFPPPLTLGKLSLFPLSWGITHWASLCCDKLVTPHCPRPVTEIWLCLMLLIHAH